MGSPGLGEGGLPFTTEIFCWLREVMRCSPGAARLPRLWPGLWVTPPYGRGWTQRCLIKIHDSGSLNTRWHNQLTRRKNAVVALLPPNFLMIIDSVLAN